MRLLLGTVTQYHAIPACPVSQKSLKTQNVPNGIHIINSPSSHSPFRLLKTRGENIGLLKENHIGNQLVGRESHHYSLQ